MRPRTREVIEAILRGLLMALIIVAVAAFVLALVRVAS